MSTALDWDLEILEQLDFEFAPPCEAAFHESLHHDGPAEWVIDVVCECGYNARKLFCEQCLVAAQAATLGCADCGKIDPGTECIRIISRV